VEESKVKKRADAEAIRENSKFDDKNTHLKNSPRGTCVDPQRLVQCIVERGTVVSKLLPQRLHGLGIVEVDRRRAGVLPLLLWARDGDIWGRQDARVMTRPRRCAMAASAPCSRPPA
jgi:hypothetical protein